jgi:hypothetical protein
MSDRAESVSKVAGDFQAIGDAARQTGQQARQAGADALDKVRDVAAEAQGRAASALDTVGEQAISVAETQKVNLAERLEDVANAVHKSGEQLEGHQDWVAKLVEQGADELLALATTLRTNDLQSLLGDLGSLARRQPALFVGASMAAGFALTRIGRLAISSSTPAPATSPSQPHPASPASMPLETAMPTPAAPATSPESAPMSAAEVGRERF